MTLLSLLYLVAAVSFTALGKYSALRHVTAELIYFAISGPQLILSLSSNVDCLSVADKLICDFRSCTTAVVFVAMGMKTKPNSQTS